MIPARIISEGQYTEKIYGMINAHQYEDAIRVLTPVAQSNSRAALSLMAYCNYHLGKFDKAAENYAQLVAAYPAVDLYKFYQAQSHYKAGNIEDSIRNLSTIDYTSPRVQEPDGSIPSIAHRALLLQAQIRYEEDNLVEARSLLEDCDADDPDVKMLVGGIEWKEKKIEQAREKFVHVKNVLGDVPSVKYNLALCHYSKNEYAEAFKIVGELVDNAVRSYPNIGIGAANLTMIKKSRRHKNRINPSNSDATQDFQEDEPSTDEDNEDEEPTSDHDDNEDSTGPILQGAAQEAAFRNTCLLEALNLRATVEYCAGLPSGVSVGAAASIAAQEAAEALNDIPPRKEEDVDPITLHNTALFEADLKPQDCFRKLAYLLKEDRAPPPTFINLLILFCRAGQFSRAADLQAEDPEMTLDVLSEADFDLIDSLIISSQSPEQGATRFESLVQRYTDNSHRLTREIQESTTLGKHDEMREAIPRLEETIGKKLLPAVIGLAKVFWDAEQYHNVEKMLWKSKDLCADDLTWRLSFAHAAFMQNKYNEAAEFYEGVVRVARDRNSSRGEEFSDALLDLQAIVLANLCVSYIMSSRNTEAEELMREVEAAEIRRRELHPNRPLFHFCIINLVIGTLYCAKDQYGFGIGRVVTSLEPLKHRLGTDTWFYAKRCLLSLADQIARQCSISEDKDKTLNEIIDFLEDVDRHGRHIPASSAAMPSSIAQAVLNYTETHGRAGPIIDGIERMDKKRRKQLEKMMAPKIPLQLSVSYEARQLKKLFLRLYAPDL